MFNNIDKYGNKIENLESLKSCINNILNIKKGSLPFRRDFGCNLEEYLFSPYTFINMKLIEADIKRSIINGCPEVIIKYYNSSYDEFNNQYNISIGITSNKIDNVYEYSTNLKIKH